ncbi:MAG: hypothetical protein C5B48_08330 [Candidatus Rokuibacteriota bacterium]|nr:MAG: hypothetical protein C5B48_08330 [Candidatus Rokubacteria bacterium]
MEQAELAVLEALTDVRIAGRARSLEVSELEAELDAFYPGESWRGLEHQGLVESWGDNVQLVVDGHVLEELRSSRELDLPTGAVTYGEVLSGFAVHRREESSAMEVRAGFLFCERLTGDGPLLLLGELGEPVLRRFGEHDGLRSAVAVYDLAGRRRVDEVRSAQFVAFEDFLAATYAVELEPVDSLLLMERRSQ